MKTSKHSKKYYSNNKSNKKNIIFSSVYRSLGIELLGEESNDFPSGQNEKISSLQEYFSSIGEPHPENICKCIHFHIF